MPKYEVRVKLDKVLIVENDYADDAILEAWERVSINGLYWADFEADEIVEEE